MLDIATLTLPPKIQTFIEAENEAARNALFDANELPHPLDDRVLVDSRQIGTICLCARLGLEKHVSYLFSRASLYEKEIFFDMRGGYNLFYAACEGGHLSVIERLITLAPDKVLALVEASNFSAFRLACARGNLLLIERLIALVYAQYAEAPQLAHKKVQAMVEAEGFEGFALACGNGHLPVVDKLIGLAPDKVLAMVQTEHYRAFQKACEGGHLAVVERLIELVSEQLAESPQLARVQMQAIVKADSFLAFRLACEGGHLAVVNWLIEFIFEQLAEAPHFLRDQVQAMVKADRFYAFRWACQGGHLAVVNRLIELVSMEVSKEPGSAALPTEHVFVDVSAAEQTHKNIQAMVEAVRFNAFELACQGGHLSVVNRLIELASDKVLAMIEEGNFRSFQLACKGGNLAVVNRLIELVSRGVLEEPGSAAVPTDLASKKVLAMVEADSFHSFQLACGGGRLAVVERLIELVSDQLAESPQLAREKFLAIVGVHDFAPFRLACYGGHLTVVNRLIELVSDLLAESPQLAREKVLAMVEAESFYAFRWACENGHLPVVNRLIELVFDLLAESPQLAHEKVQAMVGIGNFYAFQRACAGGHLAVVDRLIALVSDVLAKSPQLVREKVLAMVEAESFYAFRWACENGHLPVVNRLLELAYENPMAMVEGGRFDYPKFASFSEACRGGHFLVAKRLMELVAERAPERVQVMIAANNFNVLYHAFNGRHFRTQDLLLRNEAVLRHVVDRSPAQYLNLVSGFVNIELNILAATKSAFETDHPGLRFNIPQDRVSYYVLMLGHMFSCKDFPNRQAHIDLLMGLPSLSPLPDEHYQWCLDKALNANNAKMALRLLSKYPGPKDVVTERGIVRIKPVQELFITEGGEQGTLMHNLHLLLREHPERYHRLLEAVRLKSEIDSKAYSALSRQRYSNADILWSDIGESVNFHLHSALVMFREQWRTGKKLSTPSTMKRAAAAAAPKP